MPAQHGLSVTVPGAVQCWLDMLDQWGSLSPAVVLAPAIRLARDGFPVSPVTAHWWAENAKHQLRAPCPFLPVPSAGSIFRNPDLAETLTDVALHGRSALYAGRRAKAICGVVQKHGGMLQMEDLEAHRSEFVDPIRLRYRGIIDVFECPPNNQGLTALMALETFQSFPLPTQRFSGAHVHLLIESMRAAYVDSKMHIAERSSMTLDPRALLEDSSQKKMRRDRVNLNHASTHGNPAVSSETVSFCVVDPHGNAVSMVNSNYQGFGTGYCWFFFPTIKKKRLVLQTFYLDLLKTNPTLI